MAASTPPRRVSCYHRAQEGSGDCDHWQPWQDGYMQVSTLPVHAHRTSQADTASYHPTSLIDIQNNFDMSPVALNVGLFGINGYLNGSHDFFGNSETIPPRADAGVILDEHFGNWDLASSITSFPSAVTGPPPLIDLSDHSPLNQMDIAEFSDFDGLSNVGVWNAGLSDSVSDQLDHAHAGCHPFPFSAIEATKFR
jgi:hypothetical protein